MSDEAQSLPQRRAFYRVVYPLTARPILIIRKQTFEVIDISEKGVRFSLEGNPVVQSDENLTAVITFHDYESITLEGKILRMENNEIALLLTRGIPYKRIVKEQQFLIKNYPEYRRKFGDLSTQ